MNTLIFMKNELTALLSPSVLQISTSVWSSQPVPMLSTSVRTNQALSTASVDTRRTLMDVVCAHMMCIFVGQIILACCAASVCICPEYIQCVRSVFQFSCVSLQETLPILQVRYLIWFLSIRIAWLFLWCYYGKQALIWSCDVVLCLQGVMCSMSL